MKPKLQKQKLSPSPPRRTSHPGAASKPPLTPGRKRLFQIVALLLPILGLALVELGLRVAGYGYDSAFFKTERDVAGKQILINNDHFTFRFFPPELARWPGTFKIAADKPADVKRIFIFGESAAMGDPQPSVGPSCELEILLREKFPGQRFEIVNLGITAINSHVILPIAQEVAARGQGDIWLIYMGNNEMVGPFGAATVFGSRAPPLTAVRWNLAIQKTRVGQLAVKMLRNLGGKPKNTSWGGMKMFLQNQIPPDDARRETVYQNFNSNLRDIVHLGTASGAKIVLSTMSVNLRDCPPFGSMSDSNLPAADRARFDVLYAEAVRLQTNNQAADAVQKFEQASKLDPTFAELQFRWAQCLLHTTNTNAARDRFQKACDVDALPFRADTRINRTIRDLAAELGEKNFSFCDAEKAVTDASPATIAGDESFFEHVHFNFDGNYRLARAWADGIAKLLPEETPRNAVAAGWASQEACERGIGLSDWNRMFVVSSVVARMGQPPLAMQFNNPARLEVLQRQMKEIHGRMNRTNAPMEANAVFQSALSVMPHNSFLRENYGNFLESIGEDKRALAEYLKLTELLPHDFYGCLQAGRLLRETGRADDAEALLRRAVAQRTSVPEPWFELGKAVAAKGNFAEALLCFQQAAQLRPSDGSYQTHQAMVLSKLNRHAEAIVIYRDALKTYGGSWEGHFELAGELAAVNDVAASIKEYQETVRLNPRHAVARVNLGVMLVRQNRMDEAIQQFEAALAIEPGNAAAKDYLRQVSTRRSQR